MRGFYFRPLVLPILCFLAGVFISGFMGLALSPGLGAVLLIVQAVFLVMSFASIRSLRLFHVFTALFFFFLGVFRYTSLAGPVEGDISSLLGERQAKVFVYGKVASDPEKYASARGESLYFDLDVKKVIMDGEERNTSGKVRAAMYGGEKDLPGFGDIIVMSGKMSLFEKAMNPAVPDFRKAFFLSGKKARLISSRLDVFSVAEYGDGPITFAVRALSRLREEANLRLKEKFSGNSLAMAQSMLLGIRSGVDTQIKDILTKTGTAHILAVSGLHVGMVAILFVVVLRFLRVPRVWGNFLASAGILAFAVFAGARPSSMRAAIMGSLLLLSSSFSRKPDIVNSLAVSAFVITFFCPGQFFTAGFILSYLAVISIVSLTPLTDHFLGVTSLPVKFPAGIGTYVLKVVSVSMAVWLASMPVIGSYFGIVTPSCILANVIAVPSLFVLITFSAFVVFASCVPCLSFIAKAAAFFMSNFTEFIVKILGALVYLPGSFIRVSPPGVLFTAFFYLALAAALVAFKKRAKKIYLLAFFLFAADVFIIKELSLVSTRDTRITIFHAGKADASLLEFSDGRVMLIDSGTKGKKPGTDSARDIISPYLASRGIRRIDCVVITHPHEDHIGGLPFILENFKVGAVIDPAVCEGENATSLYREIIRKLDKKKIPRISAVKGDKIKGFSCADITVLNPPGEAYYGDANSDSVVLKIVTKEGRSVLFTGDSAGDALKDILRYGGELKSDIVKVPHHAGGLGEKAVIEEFLTFAEAKYMVVTNNKDCKINSSILKVSKTLPCELLITGESGAITLTDSPDGFIVSSKW